ncbi:MAG: hydrogenase maturation protease [Pyrinomonadaceae bacterium MAG19_C2-C3]|nr:hydrogenase maturation protease [Pyrinomonadaceae bacterium MAG19_C2-C3]
MKILIAGVGNVLRGDDGFGVEVVQALQRGDNLPDSVNVFEAGIAGVSLVQELMDGYEVLIVLDAVERGGAPGTIYIIEPEISDPAAFTAAELHRSLADAHYTEPSQALVLARALNVLPPKVILVGCQPEGYDELGAELSSAVKRAIPTAIERIKSLIEELLEEPDQAASPSLSQDTRKAS